MAFVAGTSAFVSGAASGIGRAISIALGSKGVAVTCVDVDIEGCNKTVRPILITPGEYFTLFCKHNVMSACEMTFGSQAQSIRDGGGRACAVQADVTCSGSVAAAMDSHWAMWNSMDFCILAAGIEEKTSSLDPATAGEEWRRVIEVDLISVIDGTRLAVQRLRELGAKGTIQLVASAAALFPLPQAEVYAAAKAGVAAFARSAAHLEGAAGIRVTCLCPSFVESTGIMDRMRSEDPARFAWAMASAGALITLPSLVAAALESLADESNAGKCLFVSRHGSQYWKFSDGGMAAQEATARMPAPSADAVAWACAVPASGTARRVVIQRLSPDFRTASAIVSSPLPKPPPGSVLVRYAYAGVNASDINFSSGRYFGSPKAAAARLPFDAGFEAVGHVAALGEGVSAFALGDAVGTLTFGGFAEWGTAPARQLLPLPEATPAMLALLTSGLTASLALAQAGALRHGQVVLVTAAAGGTGMFAVQLAKLAGCSVVATCGGPAKAALLRRLGVDRVVDYKAERLRQVLKAEYPRGVHCVYESVGGAMFDDALDSLATGGRIIVIGQMSAYKAGPNGGWAPSNHPGLAEKLLWKGATLQGFFLPQHAALFRQHLQRLTRLAASGKLEVPVDEASFIGVESVADAVEHLQSGRSSGKVVVQVASVPPPPPNISSSASGAVKSLPGSGESAAKNRSRL